MAAVSFNDLLDDLLLYCSPTFSPEERVSMQAGSMLVLTEILDTLKEGETGTVQDTYQYRLSHILTEESAYRGMSNAVLPGLLECSGSEIQSVGGFSHPPVFPVPAIPQ